MGVEHPEIAALYDRYGPMVLRRCRRLLGDAAQAEDAAQDVFVQFIRGRDRLTAAYPSSLLYRIATNHCLNLIRDRRREAPHVESWLREVADWEDPAPRLEARSILAKLFRRHEESTRTMAVLHLLDGMTLEEVARETGLSVSGVRKRLRGLRESLTEVLAGTGAAEASGAGTGASMEVP
jgi:RNA polymerase sigma-70 factor (ECF subfamily)